jgi:hypothetical protein
MVDEKSDGKILRLDESAVSRTTDHPAFLTPPPGAPAYYGFPLIEETATDGWYYGAISEYEDPEGCEFGDGFVQSPNGDRAGLVWEVGNGSVNEISPPDKQRWGVYGVWFPQPVRNTADLVLNFKHILPELETIYERIKNRPPRG